VSEENTNKKIKVYSST